MITYYCDKCGHKVKTKADMLVISIKKKEKTKSLHICGECADSVEETIMQMKCPQESYEMDLKQSTEGVEPASTEEPQKTVVTEVTPKQESIKKEPEKIAMPKDNIDIEKVIEDVANLDTPLCTDTYYLKPELPDRVPRGDRTLLRRILLMFYTGTPIKKIANADIKYNKVYGAITGYGCKKIAKLHTSRPYPAERTLEGQTIDTGECLALARAGWSSERIADDMQISEADICAILEKYTGV